MKPISALTKEDIKNIKLIVFDVDGVIVPRGTRIKQTGNITTLETKEIAKKQIEQIKEIHEKGFLVNINSGRGLYMLQEMFRAVLEIVSLTYENGSATWYKGKIYQHVNSFTDLHKLFPKLKEIKDKNIRGFEPKEFIITIHCWRRVRKIENMMKKEKKLYAIWNGEAYDIGIKNIQTKATGLRKVMSLLHLKKKNVLALGDNYNDYELLHESGVSVSADASRVKGDFYVPKKTGPLPAELLMQSVASRTSKDLQKYRR